VLKESENEALVSVYPDDFLDPFDEAPQDKTTSEKEEKEEAELEQAEEAIWSRCSVWGGLYEELALGDNHVFSIQTSTFDETQT